MPSFGWGTGCLIDRPDIHLAGGAAPVTLAGRLVIHNSEVLSDLVLGQLTTKGTPMMYGSSHLPPGFKIRHGNSGAHPSAV